MILGRAGAAAWVGLLMGCGGSGQPAAAPDNLTAQDVEQQTQAACQELQGCDLLEAGKEALDECVARGLYTIDGGSDGCAKAYWSFESCVADSGCGALEELFNSTQGAAECRKLADGVQQECNVNVL